MSTRPPLPRCACIRCRADIFEREREREREREGEGGEIKEGEETSVVRAKGKYTTSVSLLRESCVQKYSYMNWFSAPRHYETVLNKSFKNVS